MPFAWFFLWIIVYANPGIRGLFTNYWDRVNYGEHGRDTKQDTSTLFLSTCKISFIWLHLAKRRGHKKSITWRYEEHSDVANVTSAVYNGVNVIVTALHLHMMLNPLILYICTVNIWSVDVTAILFRSAIPCYFFVFITITVRVNILF